MSTITAKLLISARVAINFTRALDPAAIGGKRLLEPRRLLEVFALLSNKRPDGNKGQTCLRAGSY